MSVDPLKIPGVQLGAQPGAAAQGATPDPSQQARLTSLEALRARHGTGLTYVKPDGTIIAPAEGMSRGLYIVGEDSGTSTPSPSTGTIGTTGETGASSTTGAKKKGLNVGKFLVNGLKDVISFPGKVVGGIASGLINGVKTGFNAIKEATKPIWKPIENGIKKVGDFFKKLFGRH